MRKILIVAVSCIFLLAASCATKLPELSEKGPAKTIKLKNGEVIYDLNGVWEGTIDPYTWAISPYKQRLKITQYGRLFKGIQMWTDDYLNAGDVRIEGELFQGGFKSVILYMGVGPMNGTGQISEDGNKIFVDNGRTKCTLTRK